MGFRIDYANVMMQVEAIEEASSRLAGQLRELQSLEQTCFACWKGTASDAFLSKVRAMYEEMSRTYNRLLTLTSPIRYCADRIHQEDLEADRRAELLKAENQSSIGNI